MFIPLSPEQIAALGGTMLLRNKIAMDQTRALEKQTDTLRRLEEQNQELLDQLEQQSRLFVSTATDRLQPVATDAGPGGSWVTNPYTDKQHFVPEGAEVWWDSSINDWVVSGQTTAPTD